jgi:hypothetical protein
MSPLRPSLALALLLALLAAGALAVAGSASPPANGAAVAKISPIRVDGVHLGDTHADLRARGKVGRIRPGCELAENTRTARLLAPLHGAVNYTQSSPRRVDNITVTGGARARGVGMGEVPAREGRPQHRLGLRRHSREDPEEAERRSDHVRSEHADEEDHHDRGPLHRVLRVALTR